MNSLLIRFFLMLVLGLTFTQLYAEENCPEEEMIECMEEKNPEQWVSLRHSEGSGLGFAIGYTSLDLFLSKSFDNQSFLPFLDLRGHLFNNGKAAANVGIGFRYQNCCLDQIWGVNLVYDYLQHQRHYPRRSYQQVGGGIEIIGERWDFYLNAYVPVGKKKTNIYRFSYGFYEDLKRENLSDFKLGLKAREQLALNGIDTLFGYQFYNIFSTNLHISAGPYYYWGNTEKTTNAFASKRQSSWGGRLLLDIFLKEYLSIGAEVTYDTIFKWRGRGMVCLNLPFDIFQNLCSGCVSNSIRDRFYDPIIRNEIIAVDRLNRFTNDPRVLDPEFQP